MLLLALLACGKPGADTASVDPLSWAVDEAGPYNTGFRSWEITYDALPDGQPRTVVLNAWYPTEDTEGEEVRYLDAYEDPGSLGDAAAAPPVHPGGYPVHVHSHGSQSWGGDTAFLNQRLASHGWVTVAPDHTGNTLVDNLDPRPVSHYLHRPQDISAVLDALEALPADDPLAAADTGAVVLSGHSFGCYNAWAGAGASFDERALLEVACPEINGEEGCTDDELAAFLSGELADPRVAAAIPMGGGYREQFFGDSPAGVYAPFLMMTGSEDDDDLADWWDAMGAVDRTWIELDGGCHQTFALGTCGTLDTELGYQIVRTYALAFGRARILGDGDPTVLGLLDGSEVLADEVTLRRGAP